DTRARELRRQAAPDLVVRNEKRPGPQWQPELAGSCLEEAREQWGRLVIQCYRSGHWKRSAAHVLRPSGVSIHLPAARIAPRRLPDFLRRSEVRPQDAGPPAELQPVVHICPPEATAVDRLIRIRSQKDPVRLASERGKQPQQAGVEI